METGHSTLSNRMTSGDLQQKSSSLFAWCDFRPAPLLQNTSSTARDHLANERTYLAWMRTSLGFTTVGIAITQIFKTPQPAQPGSEAITISPPVLNNTRGLTTDQILEQLVLQVQQQALALDSYARTGTSSNDSQVGIGIGVTFMCIGILFLVVAYILHSTLLTTFHISKN
ncbi:uncharacterized protein MELLADRAFT_103343 [Melampsora larici-populina 98AG31]|uniref:DUF202 domain-containing protein n=1 Tax=Melampsora larici-populina (strain 98AG31 / pathotype 3-4-7) TaxID=747676 RepID=F4RB59_MELLP|nr:uncharacterized protein MELLADRAFT_103343 [Melampsora larici-populina 98AG31]EGG10410.1 hypothetical protein MELLADRAFT_103343 [Melampsora larici-populina 98AG31]